MTKTTEYKNAEEEYQNIYNEAKKKEGLDKLEIELDQEKDDEKKKNMIIKQMLNKMELINRNPQVEDAKFNLIKTQNKIATELGRDEIEKQQEDRVDELAKQTGYKQAQEELKQAVGPQVMEAKKEYEQAIENAKKAAGLRTNI